MTEARSIFRTRSWLGLWLAGLVLLALLQASPSGSTEPQPDAFRAPITALIATQPKIVAIKPVAAETARWLQAAALPGDTTHPEAPTDGTLLARRTDWQPTKPRLILPCRARAPPAFSTLSET